MSENKTIIPPVDIYETQDKYIAVLDMPGTRKEDIDISNEGDTLTITGKTSPGYKDWKGIQTEFTLDSYKREITIGNKVNRENIQAKYENGILTLEMEKSETAKPRKIEVKIA